MLIERLKKGENSDISELLILGNLRLAYYIAHGFATNNKHLKDDLISVAILALCRCVDGIKDRLIDDNIGKYLAVNIRLSILDFLRKSKSLIVTPYGVPSVITIRADDGVEYDDNSEFLDILEMLRSLPKSDVESDVLELKILGHQQNEICEIMGISKGYVSQIMGRLRARYLKMLNNC